MEVMKNSFLNATIVLLSSLLMACGSIGEEPTKQPENIRIMTQSSTPYAPLLDNAREMFWVYSYTDMHLFLDSALLYTHFYNNEANTYVLDDVHNSNLMVKDTCEVIRNEVVNTITVKRTVNLTPFAISTTLCSTVSMENFAPITFKRPNATECDPMPFCYYKDMEIEWNEADENENGVIIIAEWLGSNAFDIHTHCPSIIRVDVVEDNGVTVLNNDLFEDMPHGAKINLWLVRASMAAPKMNKDTEAMAEFLRTIENHSELGSDCSAQVKKVIDSMDDPLVVNASIALLPIILVKELN